MLYQFLSPSNPASTLLPETSFWNNAWITFPTRKLEWFLNSFREKCKPLAFKAFPRQNAKGWRRPCLSFRSLYPAYLPSFLPLNSHLPLCREYSMNIWLLNAYPFFSSMTILTSLWFDLLSSELIQPSLPPKLLIFPLFGVEAICLQNVLKWIPAGKAPGLHLQLLCQLSPPQLSVMM